MKKINDIIFKFILEPAIKIFGLALCVVIALQIFGRTFMETPPTWTEEISRFTFVWYCFLAMAVTFRAKQHLGLDYFYRKFKPGFKKVVNYVIHLLELVFGIYCSYYGVQLLSVVGKRKAPITHWSMSWFYLAVPVMGILFVLIALENFQEMITGKEEQA